MAEKLIGGVFREAEEAERAIRELKNKGYGKDDFSVFAKDKDDVKGIGKETNVDVTQESSGRGKNAGKGLGIGAGSGGVLGGLTGLLLEIGLLAIPGIGAVAAAGPLAATLAGAGVGAAGGGIVGALTGAGIPEEHAKEYEQHLKNGHIIVLVEEKENANDVYQTFMSNNTQNTNMYPNDVVNNHNHNNTSNQGNLTDRDNQNSNTSGGLGGAMRNNDTSNDRNNQADNRNNNPVDSNDNYTNEETRTVRPDDNNQNATDNRNNNSTNNINNNDQDTTDRRSDFNR